MWVRPDRYFVGAVVIRAAVIAAVMCGPAIADQPGPFDPVIECLTMATPATPGQRQPPGQVFNPTTIWPEPPRINLFEVPVGGGGGGAHVKPQHPSPVPLPGALWGLLVGVLALVGGAVKWRMK